MRSLLVLSLLCCSGCLCVVPGTSFAMGCLPPGYVLLKDAEEEELALEPEEEVEQEGPEVYPSGGVSW